MTTEQLLREIYQQNRQIIARLDALESRQTVEVDPSEVDIEEEINEALLLGWDLGDYLDWRNKHGIPRVVPRPQRVS